ncbi:MAG: hypothetical protein ACR2PZ_18075 [Pseudomonadales bacterium]
MNSPPANVRSVALTSSTAATVQCLCRVAALGLLFLWCARVVADVAFYETEPNDKPGDLQPNGEPGALTVADVLRLEYADNGIDVTSKRTLFKMGTRDGVTPSVHENLLFEPGVYLIGLAQAGADSVYRV